MGIPKNFRLRYYRFMISREEILQLATLARLKVADAEVEGLQKDISSILEYVGQISQVNVEKEKATPFNYNVMREDTPRAAGDPLAGKEEALRAAFPTREDGYNVVRKIIQKDE